MIPADDNPRPWELVKSEPGPDLTVFKCRFDWRINPRNRHRLKCLVLESRDWVNIVARTTDGEIILVKQFRFGRGEVSIEIPGGVVDRGESHADAARRELREETGFEGQRWRYLGASEPNPAILDNLCHHWLVEDAVRRHETAFDAGEDIVIVKAKEDEIRKLIDQGQLRHSLVLVALSRAWAVEPGATAP